MPNFTNDSLNTTVIPEWLLYSCRQTEETWATFLRQLDRKLHGLYLQEFPHAVFEIKTADYCKEVSYWLLSSVKS